MNVTKRTKKSLTSKHKNRAICADRPLFLPNFATKSPLKKKKRKNENIFQKGVDKRV